MMQPKFSEKRRFDGEVYVRVFVSPDMNEAIAYKNRLRSKNFKVRMVDSSPNTFWHAVYARR